VWSFYINDMGQEVPKHHATAHGAWGPERTKEIAEALGRYYNWAQIATESNIETLAILLKQYPNLYYFVDPVTGQHTGKVGWVTSRRTKPIMMNELQMVLSRMECQDVRILKEIRGMRYNDKDIAVSMGHDDLHDSTAIAMMCRQSRPQRRGYVGSYGRKK